MAFEFKKNIENAADPAAWNSVGKMMASEIGVGLNENSYLAITALENVYVELETLTKNAAKNAQNLAKKQQQRELENLKNAKELEIITEKEYYEKLKNYRDENLKQGTDVWFDCTEKIAAYNKRLLEEQEELQREMAEKILTLRENLAKKLKSDDPWIETSKTTFKGMGVSGTDLIYNETNIEDFREEIKLLESFRDKVIELKNLGSIPDGVFSKIGRMDIEEAVKTAEYILSLDEDARKRFVDGYNARETLADGIAGELNGILNAETLKKEGIYSVDELAEGFAKADKKGENSFVKVLEESFDEVPESYYALGNESGEAFGKGFIEKAPQLMAEARNLIMAEMQGIAAEISALLKDAGQLFGTGSTTSYTNTYNFNTSKDTTTQQLSAARNASALERLRGGAS